jgi:N-methylhydantoinase A
VRLIESGPAGGAIFAADIARRFRLDRVVSYDMGGTTAKICLIENAEPRAARTFEVARTYRFAKGSGMPISIPVIEMIEIGAGGGSIGSIDAMGRIQTGPESAGSEPGPACYQRGGTRPTITDADLVLGKIDADNFAGGAIRLSLDKAKDAISTHVGALLGLAPAAAAFGVCEVVDENMANAARVHAVENGKDISDNVMIAFGGAAPLHAARLCEKLSIDRCLIPEGAGVGSAIGFLKAPFAYESVASMLTRISAFDAEAINARVLALRRAAEDFVRAGASGPLTTGVTAFMRYAGQGWEIPVPMPDRPFGEQDAEYVRNAFQREYARFFGRTIDAMGDLEIEIVTWSVKVQGERAGPPPQTFDENGVVVSSAKRRAVFDPATGSPLESAIFERATLGPGARIEGPAVIVERETATVVTVPFDAVIQPDGSILLVRKAAR